MERIKEILVLLVSGPKSKGEGKKNFANVDGIIENETYAEQTQRRKDEENKDQVVLDENYYKKLFEKRKTKLFARCQERKRKFISFQDSAVDIFLKELNEESKVEGIMCSVTRQRLSSSSTYFMYAQLHFSNVLSSNLVVQVLPAVHSKESD